MKKVISIIIVLILISLPMKTQAEEQIQLTKMYTTAYCQGETTASGVPVREGICAVNSERLGMLAIVYADDNGKPGEILGYWECLDTGFGGDADGDGIGSIQEGKVIDMYFPSLEGCHDWMELTGGKCFVNFVYAEG